MVSNRTLMLLAVIVLALGAFAPVSAQDDGTVASGLNNPRNLSFGPDGTLYIAEGGIGGEVEIETPEGPGTFGMTGQITAISPDGEASVVFGNLPSAAGTGASSVVVGDDVLYVLVGGAPPNVPLSSAVLVLDPTTYRLRDYIDMFTYEATQNPDGNEIDTNVTDGIVGEDGTLYIVDAGGNTLYTWTSETGLQVLTVWSDNSVPTGIDIGPDGHIYVSFLSPAPFAPGSAFVEVLTTDGEQVARYEGLTMASDVLVADDGTVYAVEFSGGVGAEGFAPGRVVTVNEEGVTPVAEELSFPYGIAQDADGNIIVSINSSFIPDLGAGAVITIPTE